MEPLLFGTMGSSIIFAGLTAGSIPKAILIVVAGAPRGRAGAPARGRASCPRKLPPTRPRRGRPPPHALPSTAPPP